jgi:hypothetical protein
MQGRGGGLGEGRRKRELNLASGVGRREGKGERVGAYLFTSLLK